MSEIREVDKRARVTGKLIEYGIIVAFVLSLLPILWVSQYVYPQADDFGFGLRTHLAWMDTHSFVQVLKAAIDTAVFYWGDWQGTYTSSFLMSLQPGIFGENRYHLVPGIILLLLTLCMFYLFRVVLHDCMHAPWRLTCAVTALVLLVTIQNVKDQTESFTWYNAAIHYTGMQALWMLYMGLLISMVHRQLQKGGRISLWKLSLQQILSCVMAFAVGGGNNITVLWAVLINVSGIALLLILLLTERRKQRDKRPAGRVLLLMIPSSVILLAGAALNILSVGNQKRLLFIGGSHNDIFTTVMKSFLSGAQYSLVWMNGGVLLFVLWLIPMVWRLFEKAGIGESGMRLYSYQPLAAGRDAAAGQFRFPLPGLVLLYSYCLLSALFAPNYYTSGAADMLRTQNAVFYVYILLLTLNVIYFTGWIRMQNFRILRRFAEKVQEHGIIASVAAFVITAAVCLYMLLQNPVCFTSASAAVTSINGNGTAYAQTIEYNLALLHDADQPDVLVKHITVQPSILYSSEIDWWKAGTVSYYRKNSVEWAQ